MALEVHRDTNRHRRLEQRARLRGRLGYADVDEDHVAAGEQLGVGAEHRMHRGDPGPPRPAPAGRSRSGLLSEPMSNTRPFGGRRAISRRISFVDAQRRGDHDEVVGGSRVTPVRESLHVPRRGLGIGDLDVEALRGEEAHEPAPHLARAADDQRPLPGVLRRSSASSSRSWTVSEERMSTSISSSARRGGSFRLAAVSRARSTTSRSCRKSRVGAPVARLTLPISDASRSRSATISRSLRSRSPSSSRSSLSVRSIRPILAERGAAVQSPVGPY